MLNKNLKTISLVIFISIPLLIAYLLVAIVKFYNYSIEKNQQIDACILENKDLPNPKQVCVAKFNLKEK